MACGLILLLQSSATILQEESDDFAVVAQLLMLFHVRSQGAHTIPKADSSPSIERSRRLDRIYSIDADEARVCVHGPLLPWVAEHKNAKAASDD